MMDTKTSLGKINGNLESVNTNTNKSVNTNKVKK